MSRFDPVAADLVALGQALRLETHGRASGRVVPVTLGFVREPDASFLVAAGDPSADWAANLDADPDCRATVGPDVFACRAEALEGPDRDRAIRELILRGGTPAERLGRGPAYRLRVRGPSPDR